MAYCARRHGVLTLQVDGETYEISEADVTVQPLDYNLTAKAHGHTVAELVSPSVQATFMIPDELNIQSFLNICRVTLTVVEWGGRQWVLSDASATFDQGAYNLKQGEITVTFIGRRIREINATAA